MHKTKGFFPISLLLSFLSWMPDSFSQHKFEFGATIDPLVIPINLGTYIESGPGYYDINGGGKVTQAGKAYFTYWPLTGVGISVGAGIRNFRTLIEYTIPHPYFEVEGDVALEGFYPFTARGWGPTISLEYRKDRWRGNVGLVFYALSNQKANSSSRFFASTTIDSESGEILAEIEVDEEAYWQYVPNSYTLLQANVQYNIFNNFFAKFGFETTTGRTYSNLFTLKASGFTENTTPEYQLLNDYKMRNKISSFSLGVGYIIGLGKYNMNSRSMEAER